MELKAADWNLSVPGRWNLAIFTPKFIGQDVFEQPRAQMEVLVPIDSSGPIYKHEGIQIHPALNAVGVTAALPTIPEMDKARKCMIRVLGLLRRTPIVACGYNLRYVEHGLDSPIAGFRGPLTAAVDGVLEEDPQKWLVSATYTFHNGVVNYELHGGGGPAKHFFNFHLQTESQDEAIAWLEVDLAECRSLITKCLTATYGAGVTIHEE